MAWAEDLIRFALQVFDSPEQTVDALEAAVGAMKPLDTWTDVLPRRLGEQYRIRRQGRHDDKVGTALRGYIESLTASRENARTHPEPRDPIGGLQRIFEHGETTRTLHALEMFYMCSLVPMPDDVGRIHHVGDPSHRTRNTVEIWEVALEVFPRKTFLREWERIQRNLAAAQGRVPEAPADDIDHTIAIREMMLSTLVREGSSTDCAKAEYDLAALYVDRIGGNHADNLDRAAVLLESAQTVFTRGAYPADWAGIQNRLASVSSEQTRGPRAENLERAIAHCEAALTVFTREAFPVDWARVQNNLGFDYLQRIYGDPADNLEHAIACFRAALTMRTRENSPAAWADTTHNLATAYQRRLRGSRADNIETAILQYRAALKVRTREAFPAQWLNTQANLALAYSQRHRGAPADNIEEAIKLYEAALAANIREALPGDRAATRRNLANIYAERMRGVRSENLRRAVKLLEEALTVNTREAMPLDHLGASHDLGRMLMTTQNWAQASAVLADACDAFLVLYGLGLDETKSRELIEAAGSLFANAAYAAAELGDTERAFNLACEGKARLLATALHLQTLDLDAPRRQRLDELRGAIREQSCLLDRPAGTGRRDVLKRLRELRRELSALVAESTSRTGEADALALARPLVAGGGAIVVAIVTAIGGKLLLVTAGPDRPLLTAIELTELRTARITKLLGDEAADSRHNWLTTLVDRGSWPVERKQAAARLIEAAGLDLGSLLAGPLATALKRLGVAPGSRLILLLPAVLDLLPIGLSQPPARDAPRGLRSFVQRLLPRRLAQKPSPGRCLIEDYEIVYAPSLAALAKASQPAERPVAPSLAAVVNPTGGLAFAAVEGALVAAHFDAGSRLVLDQRTALPETVLTALKGRSYWHFATHGEFDLFQPHRSALYLKDGARLTVADLLDSQDLGRPRLVMLSACATSLRQIHRIPEEYVSLPGAFMAVGAAAVIGTLWPVDDLATALLIVRFYELHITQELSPATALRRAQLWLRGATCAELAAYIEGRLHTDDARQVVRALTRSAEAAPLLDAAKEPAHDVPEAEDSRQGSERPFAHPLYWGAFVLTGL
jgi:tetratricopeptide (TPR) repeat protein